MTFEEIMLQQNFPTVFVLLLFSMMENSLQLILLIPTVSSFQKHTGITYLHLPT